jgi:hypothetical protein
MIHRMKTWIDFREAPLLMGATARTSGKCGMDGCVPEPRIISASSPDLILRSIAQAMRLEGWPRAMAVQAAILRDARFAGLLRMRSEEFEPIGFIESIA